MDSRQRSCGTDDAGRRRDSVWHGGKLEDEAAQPHAPKGAAAAAHLLYRRVAEYFPDSPLAPEAAWRSADIRWQMDKLDISSLPSAKEQEAYLRPQIYEGEMKKVMKTLSGHANSRRWRRTSCWTTSCAATGRGCRSVRRWRRGCIEKYAQQFPDGPKAAEALYNAVYRQGVVVTMYTVQEDTKKARGRGRRGHRRWRRS